MPALTTLAIGGGALIGGAGAVAGGIIQGNAARDAAEAGLQGQREAIAAQRAAAQEAQAFLASQAKQAREDLRPFREAQLGAITQLQGLADPNSEFFKSTRDEATKAIQRTLAAQGLLRSGEQTQQLTGLELGLINQRAQILSGLAGGGAGESFANVASGLGTNLATVSGNLGQQVGSSFQNIGQLTGQAIIGGANALTGALSGVNNAFQGGVGQLINMKLQQQLLQSLGKAA